jgi:hypothetical protein
VGILKTLITTANGRFWYRRGGQKSGLNLPVDANDGLLHAHGSFVTWRHSRLLLGEGLASRQFIEQSLGLFQVERVEAFGEPAVDRGEKVAGLLSFALIAPQPRHTY